MLTLDKPNMWDKPISLSVYTGPDNAKKMLGQITVTPSTKIRQSTLEARGDDQLAFTGMIYFEPNTNGNWNVKTADTLDLATPVKARL
jgi:hypothetical protein